MMAESRLSLTVRFIGMGTATLVSQFGSPAWAQLPIGHSYPSLTV